MPLINAAAKLAPHEPINIFEAMGGANWHGGKGPTWPKSCTLASAKVYKDCAWWCDAQSCDQCHPNNNGYTVMAAAMMKGIGL